MNTDVKKVGLFVPSCIDQFAPQCAYKTIRLLEGLGIGCLYPDALTDCGKELFHQGDKSAAKALGEKLIEQFDECRYVVCLGSGSVVYIQKHFGQLFHNTTFHNSYRQMIDKCFDLSDFLVNVVGFEPTAPFAHTVAFMDHCTTQRDYRCLAHPDRAGLRDEPRRLLAAVPQLRLAEMGGSDVCCGLGGLFANSFAPIADDLARRKVDAALAAGADIVTSTEPSCLMHLRAYADKAGAKLKFLNMIDILVPDAE